MIGIAKKTKEGNIKLGVSFPKNQSLLFILPIKIKNK